MKEAQTLLGGAEPQAIADATRDHVASTDPATLAQHLTEGAQGLGTTGLASLAQTLLGSLSQHGHDESKVQDAGVDTTAAAGGDQQNVVALIQHAREHPEALRDAAMQFVQQNPQLLAQLPGLLQGIRSRL